MMLLVLELRVPEQPVGNSAALPQALQVCARVFHLLGVMGFAAMGKPKQPRIAAPAKTDATCPLSRQLSCVPQFVIQGC
jgi:hypothetical protein